MQLSRKSKILMALSYLAVIATFIGAIFVPVMDRYMGMVGAFLGIACREIWLFFTWRCVSCNHPLPTSVRRSRLRFCPYCGQEYECEG